MYILYIVRIYKPATYPHFMQNIIDYKFVEDLRGEILTNKIEVNKLLLRKIKKMPWETLLEIKRMANGKKVILEGIKEIFTLSK